MAKSLTSDQMMTAILSYLGILVVIPLVAVKRRDDFITFHLNQGLTLLVVEIVLWIAGFVLLFIPLIGWAIAGLLWIVWLLILVLIVIAIIKAVSGEKWVIPVIGSFKLVKLK